MATRLGHFLYWMAVIVAVLVALLGATFLTGNEQGVAVGVFLLVVAGLTYLLGRGLRYVLGGS